MQILIIESFLLLCRYVYLKISNDYKEVFGVYCGQFSGKEIIVSGNYVVLTYHSSFYYKMAFFLTFASVQAGKYNENDVRVRASKRRGGVISFWEGVKTSSYFGGEVRFHKL